MVDAGTQHEIGASYDVMLLTQVAAGLTSLRAGSSGYGCVL